MNNKEYDIFEEERQMVCEPAAISVIVTHITNNHVSGQYFNQYNKINKP